MKLNQLIKCIELLIKLNELEERLVLADQQRDLLELAGPLRREMFHIEKELLPGLIQIEQETINRMTRLKSKPETH